jgi:glycosyltransferase involved in cell wall biosynthesis
MRLLMLFAERDGGVPEHARVLTCELARRGHEVTVAGPADAIVRSPMEAAGVSFEPVPIVGDMLSPVRDARVVIRLLRWLRTHELDAVHVHGQKGGILGRIAARAGHAPVVYSPHGLGYRSQHLRGRRSGELRRAATLLVERRLGRLTAAIVACSEDERRAVLQDGLTPNERVHRIYGGAAVPQAIEPDSRLVRFRGDGPLVGTVTGLRVEKDLPTLVSAIGVLIERRVPVRCAIVGDGPCRPALQRKIAEAALTDQVLLLPFAPPAERYLAALDVFVLPSRWEGLPISVLEAMAMGLPVIATRVNGIPEAVDDGLTGLLVTPQDEIRLADAISALAMDEAARRRMGHAGRAAVVRRFALDRMVDELERLYATVSADGR